MRGGGSGSGTAPPPARESIPATRSTIIHIHTHTHARTCTHETCGESLTAEAFHLPEEVPPQVQVEKLRVPLHVWVVLPASTIQTPRYRRCTCLRPARHGWRFGQKRIADLEDLRGERPFLLVPGIGGWRQCIGRLSCGLTG